MRVVTTRQFAKDVEKELPKKLQLELALIIEQMQLAVNLKDIANLKKLRGFKTAYRLKFGDYRIGLLFENRS